MGTSMDIVVCLIGLPIAIFLLVLPTSAKPGTVLNNEDPSVSGKILHAHAGKTDSGFEAGAGLIDGLTSAKSGRELSILTRNIKAGTGGLIERSTLFDSRTNFGPVYVSGGLKADTGINFDDGVEYKINGAGFKVGSKGVQFCLPFSLLCIGGGSS